MAAPKGNQFAQKENKAKLVTIRLYPEDEANLIFLLVGKYAADKNKIIRRALQEAKEKCQL